MGSNWGRGECGPARRARPFALLAFASLAMSALPAWGAAFAWDTATHAWLSSVSGVSGTVVEEYVLPASTGLHRLDGAEHNDRPVVFFVYGAGLSPDDAASRRVRTAKVSPGTDKWSEGSSKSANIGADRVATGVRVCVNNDRIKGVRLYGRVVNRDGSLGASENSDAYDRTNCGANDWSRTLTCGAGKAISGLRFHALTRGISSESFSGISIACARIR